MSVTSNLEPNPAAPASGSLWEALAPPTVRYRPVAGEVRADVVFVGAGFLGLTAALSAARSGLSVAVIEAAQPGYGASGRNTGFVVPSLKSGLGPGDVISRLGEDYAWRLLRLVAQSGRTVSGLITENAIDCAADWRGWLQPGHSHAAEQGLKDRLSLLHESGVEAAFLSRDEMTVRTGLPTLHGGLDILSGGQINPLAYARGLAAAVETAGGRVFGDSPVESVQRCDADWSVNSSAGRIVAGQVILTTNAMVGNLCPPLRASIIPVRVFQIVTQPLSDRYRETILPSGAPVTDTRRHTFALRWSEDGRLVTGGLVSPAIDRLSLARKTFVERLRRFIPNLPDIRVEYAWSGQIAATMDALPRMISIAPGLTGVIGCNGRGVALTSALGTEVGKLVSGQVNEADFVLPVTPPRKIPFSRLAGLGPHLWLPWSNTLDRIDAAWR